MKPYVGLAATGVVATTALAIVGWVMMPEKAMSWVFMILFLPSLWAFVESVSDARTEAGRAIERVHRLMIAALALMAVVDVGTALAVHAEALPRGAELVQVRFLGLLRGALFALWGNHLPKLMSPWSLDREPFDWQGVHRFVGRIAVAAGLGMMIAWSTLSIAGAKRATVIIVVSGMVLMLGRKWGSAFAYAGREGRSRHS